MVYLMESVLEKMVGFFLELYYLVLLYMPIFKQHMLKTIANRRDKDFRNPRSIIIPNTTMGRTNNITIRS